MADKRSQNWRYAILRFWNYTIILLKIWIINWNYTIKKNHSLVIMKLKLHDLRLRVYDPRLKLYDHGFYVYLGNLQLRVGVSSKLGLGWLLMIVYFPSRSFNFSHDRMLLHDRVLYLIVYFTTQSIFTYEIYVNYINYFRTSVGFLFVFSLKLFEPFM